MRGVLHRVDSKATAEVKHFTITVFAEVDIFRNVRLEGLTSKRVEMFVSVQLSKGRFRVHRNNTIIQDTHSINISLFYLQYDKHVL